MKALDKYPIDIITHLNYGAPTDTIAVARTAREKGVYIELNGKRINFNEEEFKAMAATGVKFIINSDAHNIESIGKNHRAFNMIEKCKIPLEQIANLDKLPKFK